MNRGTMMDDILLSVCIPVYNQIDIVRSCLEHILACSSDRIEVVINDDGSTEPIAAMIEELGDCRVRYFRNEENLGHDRNILAAFSNARGKFAFLLRSRDTLLPEGIEGILHTLDENPDLSYLTTSAYNENMIPKLVYKDTVYKKGIDAVRAHNSLFVHPSGSVYNLSTIDPMDVRDFLDAVHASNRNFTVHSLLRLQLATKGDFVTRAFFSWVYQDTAETKDIAVNKSVNQASVYDSSYQKERYRTEMLWADRVLPKDLKTEQFLALFASYLYASVWKNKLVYTDRRMRKHYSYQYKRISSRAERAAFLAYTDEVEKQLKIEDPAYYEGKKKIILQNKTRDAVTYGIERAKSMVPFKKQLKRILYGKTLHLRKEI